MADVEEQAAERYEVLIEQMSQRESISEKLKEENQMEWVRRMGSAAQPLDKWNGLLCSEK